MNVEAEPGGARGFTLVEAIVALSLSTVLVLLVTTVFVAQSDFYDDVLRRSDAHDNARSVTELVAADVRRVSPNGVILADSLVFVGVIPLTMATACDVTTYEMSIFYPETETGLDTVNLDTYGVRAGSGGWTYYWGDWSNLSLDVGSVPKSDCAAVGLDTAGVPDANFRVLNGYWGFFSPVPAPGDPFVLSRLVQLELEASGLKSGTVGLYRGNYGDTLVEYASGLGDDAHFRYRLQGDSIFHGSVASEDLDQVNAVRLVAHMHSDAGEGVDTYDFELVQDIPLRNVP